MLVSLAISSTVKWIVRDQTTSPSGNFAVAWGATGRKIDPEDFKDGWPDWFNQHLAENWLVNPKKGTIIAHLPGHHDCARQSHSSTEVYYTKDETLATVVWMGKWEARDITLVDTESGHTKNVWKNLRREFQAYVDKHPGHFKEGHSGQMAFGEEPTVTLHNTSLVIECDARITKEYELGDIHLTATYSIGGTLDGIVLKLKKLTGKVVKSDEEPIAN